MAWSSLHLGMQLNSRVYRTFCLSLFSFLWQLEEPPPHVQKAEVWALRRFAPGPGNWIRPLDLRHLKHRFGHPFDFPSFLHLNLAAKVRVLHYEPQIDWSACRDQLQEARSTATFVRPAWATWYQNSHSLIVLRASAHAEALGISSGTVRTNLLHVHRGSRSRSILDQCIKKGFQAEAVRQLVASDPYNHEHVLRRKLSRWVIQEVPIGTLSRRAVRILGKSFALVPPRVALVLFRTVFNGWCTARRFHVKEAKCLLGCEPGSRQGCHDSIEHYAHCPVVKHFAMHSLNIPQSCVGGLFNFLCMKPVDDEVLTLQLLLAFAVYSATNCLRLARPQVAMNAMHEFLLQYVHQGASTMTSAQKVVHKYLALRRTRRRVA